MGATAAPLPALEIAVRGGGAALAGLELVGVHGKAHGTAGLAPFETGLEEDAIEPFFLGLMLHQARARHDHGLDARCHLAAPGDSSGCAKIFDPPVGA